MRRLQVAGGMLEVQVVNHRQRRHLGVQGHHAVGGEVEVYLVPLQRPRCRPLEIQVPQHRVSCLRAKHNGRHIGAEDKLLVGFAVEEEEELVLGMAVHHSPCGLGGEPSDAVHLALQQQACVDGNAHYPRLLMVSSMTRGKCSFSSKWILAARLSGVSSGSTVHRAWNSVVPRS